MIEVITIISGVVGIIAAMIVILVSAAFLVAGIGGSK